VFSGNQTGEIWFCPAGNSYEAQLISDAGGNYIYKNTDGTGSLSLSPEKVLTDNRHTNIWINPGINNLMELKRKYPRSPLFDAYMKRKVYCYSALMNRYWETAACYPEKVLEDLISIFHQRNSGKLHFYQQLQ
jgi:iron complex transport system substrate-binding protein